MSETKDQRVVEPIVQGLSAYGHARVTPLDADTAEEEWDDSKGSPSWYRPDKALLNARMRNSAQLPHVLGLQKQSIFPPFTVGKVSVRNFVVTLHDDGQWGFTLDAKTSKKGTVFHLDFSFDNADRTEVCSYYSHANFWKIDQKDKWLRWEPTYPPDHPNATCIRGHFAEIAWCTAHSSA